MKVISLWEPWATLMARVRWIAALDEIERLQNIVADRDSFIANHTHATALERKDHEAEIERLAKRVAELEKESTDRLEYGNEMERRWDADEDKLAEGIPALDRQAKKIERLRAENAAMSEALAKAGHGKDCNSRGLMCKCGIPFRDHGIATDACPSRDATFEEDKDCNCYLSTLSDAVARGKKLLELERRDTPVSILRHSGFRSFACKCGGFPEQDSKFCGECGSRLEWV